MISNHSLRLWFSEIVVARRGNSSFAIPMFILFSRYDHNFTLSSCLKWGHQKRVRWTKLENCSGDHPEEDDGSNQLQRISPVNALISGDDDIEVVRKKLIDLRATTVHTRESERLDVVNNGEKKPSVEDEDSNPAAACPWTLRSRPAGERNGKVVNLTQRQKGKFSIACPEKILKLISLPLPVPNHPENPRIGPELFRRRLM
nr:uncharacterized protein LOC109164445 [Ipomoea trifida]